LKIGPLGLIIVTKKGSRKTGIKTPKDITILVLSLKQVCYEYSELSNNYWKISYFVIQIRLKIFKISTKTQS